MGCFGSKPSRQQDVRLRPQQHISRPIDPPGSVPRPRRDQHGAPFPAREYALSERNILRALGFVAEFLHRRSKSLVLIAVGGAVNTVLLRTRTTTHDVDFFNTEFSGSELSLIRNAVEYAEERSSVPLGDKWLNNAAGTIGGTHEQIPELVGRARQQNDVIFQQPGLTVYAAPWDYAFVTKVGRITYGTGRAYDPNDAVAYLHQYIRRHGNRPVRVADIRRWGKTYRRNTPDQVLREIDNLYRQQHGQHGISFS